MGGISSYERSRIWQSAIVTLYANGVQVGTLGQAFKGYNYTGNFTVGIDVTGTANIDVSSIASSRPVNMDDCGIQDMGILSPGQGFLGVSTVVPTQPPSFPLYDDYGGDLWLLPTAIQQVVSSVTYVAAAYPLYDDWDIQELGVSGASSQLSIGPPISAIDTNGVVQQGGFLELEYADGTHPGIVSTGAQTLAGQKNFASNVTIGGIGLSGWKVAGGDTGIVQAGVAAVGVVSNVCYMFDNLYNDGTNFRYISTFQGFYYAVDSGTAHWHFAPSGTAGAIASPTQVALIDSKGQFLAANYGAAVNPLGTVGATATCDFTKSSFNSLTLTSATACSISFTAPANPCYVQVKITAPASGSIPAVTWPASVVGGPPNSVTTLGKSVMNTFFFDGASYIWQAGSPATGY